MIAVDWSHTKGLTTFDGKRIRTETAKQLITRLGRDGEGGESIQHIQDAQSKNVAHPPLAILEQGCPLSLIYRLTIRGISVRLIDNQSSEQYRREHSIEKTDENDAKILYHLASNGAILQEITLDDKTMQLHDLYHQYCRHQKARVALQLMKKGHLRRYSVGQSIHPLKKSNIQINPTLSLSTFDSAINILHAKEKSLLKNLEETVSGLPLIPPPTINGLGKRIWIGLMVTANPTNFKYLPSYLRFCGLTDITMTIHRFNRHARMLYHLLAKEILIKKDPEFRPIYDKCKTDIALKHPDYTKMHIHNAALNRTATFLAKKIFHHCHIN